MVVAEEWRGNAIVVVANAKKETHINLKPHENLPDDDDVNTIFVRVNESA